MSKRMIAVCSLMADAAVLTLATAIQRDPVTYTLERPDADELEPCSKWRDIGPSTVQGLPRNAPRGRLLCSTNGQPGEHLAANGS